MRRLGCGIAATALLVGAGAPTVQAQLNGTVAGLSNVEDDAPLLLEADQLIYDQPAQRVAAVGGVRIDYAGNRLVADRVVYNQQTGRLLAIGNVEIIQPDNTRLYADEIDVTDDFGDGFVKSLRIVTPDETYLAADSAVRENGRITTFERGVYTACEPCEENPDRAPIWQVKSRRVIWDGEKKTIRFENARFEFFGVPIAALPVFTTADPTVKRKSGFLMPGFRYQDELGFGLSIPYYLALAPNYDLTLTGTGYTKQGFLGEAEFRHRLKNGTYTLKAAGIHQMDPPAFGSDLVSAASVNRGMIGTTGRFEINPRWTFGWEALVQSDKKFAYTYAIDGFSEYVQKNEIYLTGLHDRSFFDLRVMNFDVQESIPNSSPSSRDDQQPWVLPSLDYNKVVSRAVAGGELSFDVNARGIYRESADTRGLPAAANYGTLGVQGESGRFTAQTEWRRTFIAPGGLALTPIAALEGDANYISSASNGPISATLANAGESFDGGADYFRGMATAGLEARWPVLFTIPGSSHVIEPMAQVFLRPDEMYPGLIPNEDAQSLVFDATNLFDRDKFSGYDRIEGGSRANVGIRYTGAFGPDWSLQGLFGQSYHLAGTNSFANPDLVNAGAESGLETDVSDFVGMMGVTYSSRFTGSIQGRFDKDTFDLQRVATTASYSANRFSLSGTYAFAEAQPTYGFANDRREVSASGSVRLREFWTLSGGGTYDLERRQLSTSFIGLAYDDECFGLGATYVRTEAVSTAEVSHTIAFRLSLRTIGDFASSSAGLGVQ